MTFIEADEIGAVSPLCLVYFFPITGYTISNLKVSLDFKNRRSDLMNLAKISANGQITVPVEIRRLKEYLSAQRLYLSVFQ